MFERFTERARQVVVLSQEESRQFNHPYIGCEHLLLGVIDEQASIGASTLARSGVTRDRVLDQLLARIPVGSYTPTGHIPFDDCAKRALAESLHAAAEMGHDYIGTGHLLLGLVRVADGMAAQILMALGVQPVTWHADIAAHSDARAEHRASEQEIVASTSPGARVWSCSLCGETSARRRELVTIDRTVLICDVCLRTGVALLDGGQAVATAAGGATSPLWVAVREGVARSDPSVPFDLAAGAADPIAAALASMFVVSDDGSGLPAVFGGGNLGASVREAHARHPYFARTKAVPASLEFTSPTRANVTFLLGNPEEGVRWAGEVVCTDGIWQVTRNTVTQILQQAGVVCPPPLS